MLNTAEAADELFVNRSKNFSSRSPPHVAHDIMSAGQRQVFLPYDKEWKASPTLIRLVKNLTESVAGREEELTSCHWSRRF